MRTEEEIRQVLEMNRDQLGFLKSLPKRDHDPESLGVADGWVSALEWVLEGESMMEEKSNAD